MPCLIHDDLASVDEVLDLDSDIFGVAEVLLEVLVRLLELLDLSQPSRKFGLGVALELLRLLDLLLGPSPLGRDLHEVRGVALRDYRM